ncbi:hypothetical protein MFLAVUS_003424 [Mucor flavus]|uniref:Zn(2)-C6 fungal-type domain-containing protein n=1 Tax=Mucor flavus TaxID=439312 RepID=A0ABP9YT35_9FUNG
MSTASVVKHQLKHKEDLPRQKRFKVGKACFTCRVKKIKCDGLQPCMQCKARSRPCSFSKDGEGEEEEEEEEDGFNSPIVSPIIDSPATKKIRQSNTMANSIVATEILNRLNKIIPGEGREGKWEFDHQQLTIHNTKVTECKQPKIDLPSKPIQQHLIQLYFKHCYSTFPIIPKRLFFKQFESSTRKLLTSPILLLMIFAHGAQYQQKSIMDADLYFKQAKMLLDYELNNPSQSTIIALTLMSLYETGNNQCNTMYCVMAIQLCFDLDLLKNYTSEFIELRKRICWSCYYLDKLIHSQLGQPWILKSKDIKLDMPLLQPGDDVIEHEILEGFVSTIKLLQITEKIQHQHQHQQQPRQGDELTNWLRSLPLHLQPDSLTNRLTCQLHLLYNFIELSVLKPYSFGTTKPNQQKSITIATNLTRLITILVTNQTWIFNYSFTTYALFESIKTHLKNCGSININTAQHARFMFQQSMQTMQSLLILDQKRNAITSNITNFLTTLDQALTDADLNQEDMMTPFVLGSLNARNGVEEERQQWSKLDYFSNGLIHPPVVKSKSNLYYNLPLYNNNNSYSNNHLFQNSWRAQPQAQTQTPAELLLNQTQTSDIAALVAQIQDTNEGNKSNNASETTTSTPTNNNEDILYSLLSDQQPETQPEPVSEPQQQQQQRHYNSFSYPYTNVGLGIYASAHQHHNDVIRQHLPNSRSVALTHQGQVIVATDNHGHQ